ncbi:MAG: AAA family ATPase [Alistipes sp.]|nr:AAA family ATPase [Alistipes sp.]
MILFLVGYAGSGKSSLAKRLSRKMGVKQLDTDKLVEEREGASVADIFYYQGEEYFRQAERSVVEELVVSGYEGIVATGGGLPTWGDNMARMNEVGYTIYLRRSPEQILSRLSDYGREKRPMFRGKSDEELLSFMHEHIAQREPYYAQAKMVIDCDTMSDDDVVGYISNSLK